jgi:hypothetical protein
MMIGLFIPANNAGRSERAVAADQDRSSGRFFYLLTLPPATVFARLASRLIFVVAPPLTAHDQVFVKDGERCWFVKLADIRLFKISGSATRVYFEQHQPLIARSLPRPQGIFSGQPPANHQPAADSGHRAVV